MSVDFDSLFSSFSTIKIGVVGDLMLDTYLWGHVDRISPEAPVPIVRLDKREYRIGGAGNVALNLVSLGARVEIFSVVGTDPAGDQLRQLLEYNQIDTDFLNASDARITTNKSRIISMNQQMLRVDSETTQDLTKTDEDALLERIQTFIETQKPQALILEDYNKGVLTKTGIERIISVCKKHGVFTAVDPKRKNFFEYRDVNLFKPNLSEVKQALNIGLDDVSQEALDWVHELLKEKLNHQISLVTLSEKGVYLGLKKGSDLIPSHIRRIADVSGAGDTVIAVAALIYVCTKDPILMTQVANIAGGLVCEEVGTVAIDRNRLLSECRRLLG